MKSKEELQAMMAKAASKGAEKSTETATVEKLLDATAQVILEHSIDTTSDKEAKCIEYAPKEATITVPALLAGITYRATIKRSKRREGMGDHFPQTDAVVMGYPVQVDNIGQPVVDEKNGLPYVYPHEAKEAKDTGTEPPVHLLAFKSEAVELMTFRVTWDEDRNSPAWARAKEDQINLVPIGFGTPKKEVDSKNPNNPTGKTIVPDWTKIPKMQAVIESKIISAEDDNAPEAMKNFHSLIRVADNAPSKVKERKAEEQAEAENITQQVQSAIGNQSDPLASSS